MRAGLPILLCLLAVGVGCGEPDRLRDYLPKDSPPAQHADPLLGPLDEDDVRSPTDVDHATARGKLVDLAERIRAWQAEHGSLPDGLDDLTHGGNMESGRAIIPDGGWRLPVDPWGNVYTYERLDEGGFSLRSLGPDGERNTVDDLVELVPMGPADIVPDK